MTPPSPRTVTVIGGSPLVPQPAVLDAVVAQPAVLAVAALPAHFPVTLREDQMQLAQQNLAQVDFLTLPTREIVTLGGDVETALHRTLDGFLSRIEQGNNPQIFKLIANLKEAVDKEDLPALAQRILNPEPTLLSRIGSLFNKAAAAKALAEVWEETRRIALGKTKTLVDVVQKMDSELRQEQHKLDTEIRALEQLKESYRDRYSDFVVVVAFLSLLLARAREQVAQAATGSLFNASRYRPAFEDRRARMVGDLVTVQIVESVTASQKQDSGVKRGNKLSAGIDVLPLFSGGAAETVKDRFNAGVHNSSDFSGSGSTTNVNAFTGTISTTVVDVLPNGHLIVSGEKQVGVNQNVDVLRFTGTVDPRSLRPGSTVASNQVANVRIESRGRGQGSEAQSIGWLSRFFLNVMPF